MIAGECWKLLDDRVAAQIDTAAIRLLEHGGVRIHHEGLLGQLGAAGCRVDPSGLRAFIPERLVRDSVAALGGQRDLSVRIPYGWNPARRLCHCGSYPHLLDWPSGVRRLATRDDVVAMAKMAHVLPEYTEVGVCLVASDVDPRIEPLWQALEHARITDKPVGGGEVFSAAYLEDLVRMGEVLSGTPGDTRLIAACDAFTQPLILEPNQAAMFVEKRRLGLSVVPATMPICGMSAPITLAGGVTLAVAELLAGWTMGHVIAPHLPAGGIVSSGIMDLRRGTPLFGTPETALMNAATLSITKRLYGIGIWAATSYTDCKRPGLEAAFQKMCGLLTLPFGQTGVLGDDGLLSAGQDYCPVEQMLECEMKSAVGRFLGSFETNGDTLATELVLDMMARERTDFLSTDHTFVHYAGEQWYPRWLDRIPWQGTAVELESEATMLARIDQYCRDAIRRYEPPAVDHAQVRQLERIYAAAEKRLLKNG